MFPRGALIYLTNACNLNCSHCGVVNNDCPEYMSKECFYETISVLKEKKCYVVAISGGDPILHPDLFEFLKQIRANKMLPVLGLSGVNLNKEQIAKLANAGLGCIQVSLDGSNEKTNEVFRGPGTYNEIVNNIKRFRESGINVNLAICLCKENIEEFIPLMDLARKLKVYQLKVQFWEATPQCAIYTELTKEEKRYIKETAMKYRDEYGMHSWIALDAEYLDDQEAQKKFMVLPNGDVKINETAGMLGNILFNREDIIRYYE